MSSINVIETDVLVIGGGTAGCFAAMKAKEWGVDVTIVDKGYAGKSGSSIAAGGCWLVLNLEWGHDFNASMKTVAIKGEYINNREWTEAILKDSWGTFQDLNTWGVEFPVEIDKMKDYEKETYSDKFQPDFLTPPFGKLPLRHRKTTPVLRKQAEKAGVNIRDRIMITDLLKQDGKIVGAVGFSIDSYDSYIFKAKTTIMCGGNNSFRPPGYHTSMLTGDAEAMAYRAGAEITGKEFADTHFNLAHYPAWKSNAELYPAFFYFTDAEGNYIEHSGMDLSMAFAIHAGKGPILFDLDAATPDDVAAMQEYIRKRANPIEVERIGLDVSKGGKYEVIGGSAAGHSDPQTAGIWVIDTKGTTNITGLFAAGDCCGTRACGAMHTAGGWGLGGASVTGRRAGAGAAEYALQVKKPVINRQEQARVTKLQYAPTERKSGFSPRWVTRLLQNTVMPYYVLHVKHGERLQAALTMVEFMRDHLAPRLAARDTHELRLAHETKNMILNAEMILQASLFRTESRGQHYREDFPRRDDPAWLAWIKIKEAQGSMKLSKEPVPKEWWPDLSQPYEERYPLRFPGE